MIEVKDLDVCYGPLQVLWSVNMALPSGQIGTLLGSNGAGKSTLLAAVSGLVRPAAGQVLFEGEDIGGMSSRERLSRGVVHVLERQRTFPFMTVRENLQLGAYLRPARRQLRDSLERVCSIFPFLEGKMSQPAGTLSGGEQQMVVISRGLISLPRLLLLDEPLLGLSPVMAQTIVAAIRKLNEDGLSVLFSEQHIKKSLRLSEYACVLSSGRVAISGRSADLMLNDTITDVYMGQKSRGETEVRPG
jgi:branched-chain amino acid transport system ATP-binding protein